MNNVQIEMNNPIFPGVGKCLMIHKARQGTRNLERRGNVAYFSSLVQHATYSE